MALRLTRALSTASFVAHICHLWSHNVRLCLITALLLGLWSAVEILDDVVVAKTNCSYKVKRLQMKTCFVIVGTMKMTQHEKEMFIDNIFIVLFWHS